MRGVPLSMRDLTREYLPWYSMVAPTSNMHPRKILPSRKP